jgi:catechol 2,3-dioxygenase-like lactoylglutathione lyase family enzyme
MKLNRLVSTLWVSDIEQTISFYRNVLGFECTNRMEGWACLVNHKVELMVSLPNHHETLEKLGFTGSFYFIPKTLTVCGSS